MKRSKVTNVTNPKPLQGCFQTFRKYLVVQATFRWDKPKNLDTGHVYVLGLKICSKRLSDTCIVSPQSVSTPTWNSHAGRIFSVRTRLPSPQFSKSEIFYFSHLDAATLEITPPRLGRSLAWAVLYSCTKTGAASNSAKTNLSNFQLLQRPAPQRSQLLGREPKKEREG